MTTSQKHPGRCVVPWFNCAEWRHVCDLIFLDCGHGLHRMEAFKMIKMWRMRVPHVCCGVEGTYIILEALLQDVENISGDNLRSLYATSIMRFLNICAANSGKQGTFYKTAKKNGLPDWLINIRHDFAHDKMVPTKFVLENALNFCLNWLKEKYWDLEYNTNCDCIAEDSDIAKKKITYAVEIYSFANMYSYYTNPRKLGKIPLHEELHEKFHFLFGDKYTTESLPINVLNDLQVYIEELVSTGESDAGPIISDALLANEGFFALPNSDSELKDFFFSWEKFVCMLYAKRILLPLLKELFSAIFDEDLQERRRNAASLWLAEISSGLLKVKLIHKNCMQMNLESNTLDKRTMDVILKSVVEKDNPHLLKVLNFEHLDADLIEALTVYCLPLIRKPTKHSLPFLHQFLLLHDYPQNMIDDIEVIIKSSFVQKNYNGSVPNGNLYTVGEFTTAFPAVSNLIEQQRILDSLENNSAAPVSNKRWTVVEDTSIFKDCPLGVLAHQSRTRNPLLSSQTLNLLNCEQCSNIGGR